MVLYRCVAFLINREIFIPDWEIFIILLRNWEISHQIGRLGSSGVGLFSGISPVGSEA